MKLETSLHMMTRLCSPGSLPPLPYVFIILVFQLKLGTNADILTMKIAMHIRSSESRNNVNNFKTTLFYLCPSLYNLKTYRLKYKQT